MNNIKPVRTLIPARMICGTCFVTGGQIQKIWLVDYPKVNCLPSALLPFHQTLPYIRENQIEMGGGYGNLQSFGGLIIWTFKLFRGDYSECKKHKYSFEVGFGFIMLVVAILYFI